MAEHLGMTVEEVHDCYAVLEAHGLSTSAYDALPADRRRVLDALPSESSGESISSQELAEKVGMSTDEVKEHLRALDELGWLVD